MTTTQDLSDLRAYTERLVRTNLFLSPAKRMKWIGLLPQMNEENLKDLINAFKENQENLEKALMEHFAKNPESKLVEKIKQYKKDSMKKIATDVKRTEAEEAEKDLDTKLNNL